MVSDRRGLARSGRRTKERVKGVGGRVSCKGGLRLLNE